MSIQITNDNWIQDKNLESAVSKIIYSEPICWSFNGWCQFKLVLNALGQKLLLWDKPKETQSVLLLT